MLNIEKYKDDILNAETGNITCCVYDDILHLVCIGNCVECKKHAMEWLLEEYKAQILDDGEKAYLSAVIKPFREKVSYISKFRTLDDNSQYIYINMKYNRKCTLPIFPRDSMYKGMIEGKHYSLKELGL